MKTAVIILADGFEEIEAVTSIDLLRRAGVRVVVAGLTSMTAASARGLLVSCDTTLEKVSPGWDLLILPGGMPGASNLAESPLVKQILDVSMAQGKWIAAICASPATVLGRHGFLQGKAFTGYPGSEEKVSGAHYKLDPVVVDGKIVTSRGVGTAGAFALKLVELLAGPEIRKKVAEDVLLN